MQWKTAFILLFVLSLLTLFSPFQSVFAQSGIFDPGRFSGIFEGIRGGLEGIFGGGKPRQPGGARIPLRPITPPPLQPNPPPVPDAAELIKVWLEWDALSVGSEAVEPGPYDPFENDPNQNGKSHREIIVEKGCQCAIPIEDESCAVDPGSIKHVLYSWCGGVPVVDDSVKNCPPNTDSCIPLCDVGRDNKDRCIPTKTPGPNTDTLPFAISDKYLRRDGYTYLCIPTPCIANCPFTQNYIEFQTEIYHSNDLESTLLVENQSNHLIKNVEVNLNNLTYKLDASLEDPLPHNLDYPVNVIDTDWPPKIEYQHGSELNFSSLDTGGDAPLELIPPLRFGPLDYAAKEVKKFPLQQAQAMRFTIPSSVEDPRTCEGGAPAPLPTPTGLPVPAPPGTDPKPCACKQIISHDKSSPPFPSPFTGWNCPDGPFPKDDFAALPEPERIELCRLYYGIRGGKYGVIGDEGGIICDKDCWQVDGCPPPWCYKNARCQKTDYSVCPGGVQISAADPSLTDELAAKFKNLLEPEKTSAYGCGVTCIEEPRYGIKGQGAIVPRDYDDITNNSTNDYCKLREFKDVTEYGGCGYEASSNNSVIGPIQMEVKYGENQTSRSVLLASLPIGGQIIDDEARPFSWPASGKILQNWGNTGQAQEQGSYRSTPNQLYTDYLYCPAEGKTYPDDGRVRAGDWLHPGIDLMPVSTAETENRVYSTHAGFITFAGDASNIQSPGTTPIASRKESGTVVQIEADVNKDNISDYATRYSHLEPGSLNFDVRWKRLPRIESSKPYLFGEGPYVARNQLLGLMGDSGTPGVRKVRYDILYGVFPAGNPTFWGCASDPYVMACLMDEVERFFFSKSKFEPDPVLGPVYKNP